MADAIECDYCGNPARYGIEDRCRACHYPVAQWAPNVQLAEQTEHTVSLQEQYEVSRTDANARGAASEVDRLEQLLSRTSAVVSVPCRIAFDLFTQGSTLYAPYAALVRGHARAPAALPDDRRRRGVESLMYGGYAENIVYAALSPNGAGLSNYGQVYLQLKERTIGYRSTVLVENSYTFTEKHGLTPESSLPTGQLAPWAARGRLGVVKLGHEIRPGMSDADLERLILKRGTDRTGDDFLEVHIYGTFSYEAVDSLRVRRKTASSSLAQSVDDVLIAALHERVASLGLPWIEE